MTPLSPLRVNATSHELSDGQEEIENFMADFVKNRCFLGDYVDL